MTRLLFDTLFFNMVCIRALAGSVSIHTTTTVTCSCTYTYMHGANGLKSYSDMIIIHLLSHALILTLCINSHIFNNMVYAQAQYRSLPPPLATESIGSVWNLTPKTRVRVVQMRVVFYISWRQRTPFVSLNRLDCLSAKFRALKLLVLLQGVVLFHSFFCFHLYRLLLVLVLVIIIIIIIVIIIIIIIIMLLLSLLFFFLLFSFFFFYLILFWFYVFHVSLFFSS